MMHSDCPTSACFETSRGYGLEDDTQQSWTVSSNAF